MQIHDRSLAAAGTTECSRDSRRSGTGLGEVAEDTRGLPGEGLGCRRLILLGSVKEDFVADYLYTKNGIPLKVSGERIYNPSGRQFGRTKASKVYGSDGRYVGTIVGDRLIYRSTDSAAMGSSFVPSMSTPTARANRVASALSGDEPDIGA
jgi:hypothetical protein